MGLYWIGFVAYGTFLTCSLWILCQSGYLKHPVDLTSGYDILDQNLRQKFNIAI